MRRPGTAPRDAPNAIIPSVGDKDTSASQCRHRFGSIEGSTMPVVGWRAANNLFAAKQAPRHSHLGHGAPPIGADEGTKKEVGRHNEAIGEQACLHEQFEDIGGQRCLSITRWHRVVLLR